MNTFEHDAILEYDNDGTFKRTLYFNKVFNHEKCVGYKFLSLDGHTHNTKNFTYEYHPESAKHDESGNTILKATSKPYCCYARMPGCTGDPLCEFIDGATGSCDWDKLCTETNWYNRYSNLSGDGPYTIQWDPKKCAIPHPTPPTPPMPPSWPPSPPPSPPPSYNCKPPRRQQDPPCTCSKCCDDEIEDCSKCINNPMNSCCGWSQKGACEIGVSCIPPSPNRLVDCCIPNQPKCKSSEPCTFAENGQGTCDTRCNSGNYTSMWATIDGSAVVTMWAEPDANHPNGRCVPGEFCTAPPTPT